MTCDEFKDQLVELSMGTLEASRRAEVLAHLRSGCAECNSFLAETREAVAAAPFALEPIQPPADARDRLLERIAADAPSSRMRIGPAQPAPRRFGIFQALAGGAIAAGIMAAIFWQAENRQRQELASLQAQLNDTRATIDQLKSRTDLTNDAVRVMAERVQMMQSPGVQMVSLEGTKEQPKAKARAYWDADKKKVYFYAADVAPAPAGMAYELWIIDDKSNKIPAGMFTPDQIESGMPMNVPGVSDAVVMFAVTQEPAKGSAQPTGAIQMAGKI
jgi:hypothetical protein